MILRLYLSGTPRPQPRPRFTGGKVVSTGSRLAKTWKDRLTLEFKLWRKGRPAIDRPVKMACEASFPTRKSERWGKPHTFKPDKDNLEKLVMDAMKDGGVIRDDSLIFEGVLRKVWAQEGGLSVLLLEQDEAPPAEADDLGALVLDA